MPMTELNYIDPDEIVRNPDNPRLIFRQDELDVLLNSIKKVGIRVPLSVFRNGKGGKLVLLDGERRWLCAKKLNLETVPAIIEPKPSRLENILRMFNIHNVRVQWDLLAIALKIKDVEMLLANEGKPHTVKDLAGVTGLSLTTVNRAFGLLELPQKYLSLLESELKKPKSEQRVSEDFFLEVQKTLKAIERHVPRILDANPKHTIIQKFLDKYEKGVITNIVRFRDVSKIARSEKAGISKEKAMPIIERLINEPSYTIEQAYTDSVAKAYEERSLKRDIEILIEKLENIKGVSSLDKEVVDVMKRLDRVLNRILKEV